MLLCSKCHEIKETHSLMLSSTSFSPHSKILLTARFPPDGLLKATRTLNLQFQSTFPSSQGICSPALSSSISRCLDSGDTEKSPLHSMKYGIRKGLFYILPELSLTHRRKQTNKQTIKRTRKKKPKETKLFFINFIHKLKGNIPTLLIVLGHVTAFLYPTGL